MKHLLKRVLILALLRTKTAKACSMAFWWGEHMAGCSPEI